MPQRLSRGSEVGNASKSPVVPAVPLLPRVLFGATAVSKVRTSAHAHRPHPPPKITHVCTRARDNDNLLHLPKPNSTTATEPGTPSFPLPSSLPLALPLHSQLSSLPGGGWLYVAQDELLDAVYWLRQIIALLLGVAWGIAGLQGMYAIVG